MVHRSEQALALRRVAVRGPAEGVDLEAMAIVQLQQFGHQQAHGVVVQVAREVADLDAPAARRHLRVQRHRRRLGHALVHETQRGHELQRGVIAHAHHGQRRGADELHVQADIAQRLVERPDAQLLAHMHVVLDDVELRRAQQQAALHQAKSLRQALHGLEQPRAVVQRMQVQLDVAGHGRRGVLDGVLPLRQRFLALAAALHQVAEVEVRGREVGVDVQRQSIGALGFVVAPKLRQQGSPVEAGHVLERRAALSNPVGVELRRSGRLRGVLQLLRALHELVDVHRRRLRGHGCARRNGDGVCRHGCDGRGGHDSRWTEHGVHGAPGADEDGSDPRQPGRPSHRQ